MRADKRLGQHFLEPAWAAKLVDLIGPRPGETLLEIGPGHGALTRLLAASGARIVAVEIDRSLAAALRRTAPPNLEVVTADFLAVDVAALVGGAAEGFGEAGRSPIRVVGNLPYNVAAPILFKLLALYDHQRLFWEATLMLQQEVADRLLAGPGTRKSGVLGILVGLRATVTSLLRLPPGAFRPAPAVSSAVVRLSFHPLEVTVDIPVFERLVRGLFQHRRKTLLNCLRAIVPPPSRDRAGDILAKAGLDPVRRPETLDLTELARLAAFYAAAHR